MSRLYENVPLGDETLGSGTGTGLFATVSILASAATQVLRSTGSLILIASAWRTKSINVNLNLCHTDHFI